MPENRYGAERTFLHSRRGKPAFRSKAALPHGPSPRPGASTPLAGQHGCQGSPYAPQQRQEKGQAGLRWAHAPQRSRSEGPKEAESSPGANRREPGGPSGTPQHLTPRCLPAHPAPQHPPQRVTEVPGGRRRAPWGCLTLLQGLQRGTVARQILLLAVTGLRRRHLAATVARAGHSCVTCGRRSAARGGQGELRRRRPRPSAPQGPRWRPAGSPPGR